MADRRSHPAWLGVPGVGLGLAIFRSDLQANPVRIGLLYSTA